MHTNLEFWISSENKYFKCLTVLNNLLENISHATYSVNQQKLNTFKIFSREYMF